MLESIDTKKWWRAARSSIMRGKKYEKMCFQQSSIRMNSIKEKGGYDSKERERELVSCLLRLLTKNAKPWQRSSLLQRSWSSSYMYFVVVCPINSARWASFLWDTQLTLTHFSSSGASFDSLLPCSHNATANASLHFKGRPGQQQLSGFPAKQARSF